MFANSCSNKCKILALNFNYVIVRGVWGRLCRYVGWNLLICVAWYPRQQLHCCTRCYWGHIPLHWLGTRRYSIFASISSSWNLGLSQFLPTPFLLFLKYSGSVWISSEMKGLNDDCEHFECFPPGHLYSSKTGGFRRWYNPPWFSEAIPSVPYDPLVLRRAFENVRYNEKTTKHFKENF